MRWTDITPPWDERLARALVKPLARTPVTPNVVTTAGLVSGLLAAVLFALGGASSFWAPLLLAFAFLTDHADGHLARMTGRSSVIGHYYDTMTDALVIISMFIGIGIGLRHGAFGSWSIVMGVCAGVFIAAMFAIIVFVGGRNTHVQPHFAGFELADVLYLIIPISWMGWLEGFLILAAVGSPIYLVVLLLEIRSSDVQVFQPRRIGRPAPSRRRSVA